MNEKRSESDRILQIHRIEEMDHLFDGPWVTLYQREEDSTGLKSRRCALLTKDAVSNVLKRTHFDIITEGAGVQKGMEQLVFSSQSPSGEETRMEIAEEFRHFHQLWHDRERDYFTCVNDEYDGEEIVVKIVDGKICVKRRHLKEFMASKQMFFVSYFALDEEYDGKKIPKELKELNGIDEQCFAGDRAWERYDVGHGFSISRLVGKIAFPPPPMPSSDDLSKSRRQYESYIIGEDGDGREITRSCDPSKIDTPDAGSYKFVFFSRKILEWYYRDPDMYTVGDGFLREDRLRGWYMPIDNNHPSHIGVFLKDLALMSYKDQKRWGSCNLPVSNREMSNVGRRRARGDFNVEPEAPDLLFKNKFTKFQEDWKKCFGWELFRLLKGENSFVFKQMHIPADESVNNFGEQVLNLAKLLVDSLNSKQLDVENGFSCEEDRSIDKFEHYLKEKKYTHVDASIKFLLRDLQGLRSSGSAHPMGENYRKLLKKRHMEKKKRTEMFILMLNGINTMLDNLREEFLSVKMINDKGEAG